MTRKPAFLICASLLMLSACEQANPNAVQVYHYGKNQGNGSIGAHAVTQGETVYTISERYNLPMQDLIRLNRLQPPFILQTGQRLLLPAPATYRVRAEDTLYSVSRLFKTSVTDLARLNNLQPPYVIGLGQELRIPSSVAYQVDTPLVQQEERSYVPLERQSGGPVETRPSVSGETLEPLKTEDKNDLPTAVAQQLPDTKAEKVASVPKEMTKRPKVPARGSGKFLKPVSGNVISSYGAKADTLRNDGINIKAPKGSPVKVAENGVVIYSGNDLESYGNLILVKHADNYVTAYAHLEKSLTSKGATVTKGQNIGTVGATGNVKTPQLHFEIRRGTETLNPEEYL